VRPRHVPLAQYGGTQKRPTGKTPWISRFDEIVAPIP